MNLHASYGESFTFVDKYVERKVERNVVSSNTVHRHIVFVDILNLILLFLITSAE
jgi:hypothetical protein